MIDINAAREVARRLLASANDTRSWDYEAWATLLVLAAAYLDSACNSLEAQATPDGDILFPNVDGACNCVLYPNGETKPCAVCDPKPAGGLYVACRQCDECGHCGINDDNKELDVCNSCGQTAARDGPDHCEACGEEGTMCIACPECGGLYRLMAEETLPIDQEHHDR